MARRSVERPLDVVTNKDNTSETEASETEGDGGLMTNGDIIQELYRAFETEGLDRVLELCDPDCVVTQDEALPWGGRHEGFDQVATFAMTLGGTIHSVITTDAMFEAGDRVIQFGRSRGQVLATGAGFDMPEVHIWTLRRGKVVAAEFYVDTQAMLVVLGQVS